MTKSSNHRTQTTVKLVLLMICGGLLLALTPVHATTEFVLISTTLGAKNSHTLRDQVASWQQSGMVAEAQLFDSESGEEVQFQQFGILSFLDSNSLQQWREAAQSILPQDTLITEVDLLADIGHSPHSISDSVFLVMQYDVLVDRRQFKEYIEGYQLPEMKARKALGGLMRYTSFFARPGSSATWQSLLIMEYKNPLAYTERLEVNKSIGEQLAREDARFRSFKKIKHSLRTKTATTRAHWVALSNTESAE
jgi:hypothetical protein